MEWGGGRTEKLEGADTRHPIPQPSPSLREDMMGAQRGMQDGWGQVRAGYEVT